MGLVPSMHQSGTSFYTGKITKEGSKRLRAYPKNIRTA
ncbi:MAG: IS110 family transposase [Candidatus Methanoperedens sp.]|nr:IS110 family transposase [Candidatus Methanoperedens sp.]